MDFIEPVFDPVMLSEFDPVRLLEERDLVFEPLIEDADDLGLGI